MKKSAVDEAKAVISLNLPWTDEPITTMTTGLSYAASTTTARFPPAICVNPVFPPRILGTFPRSSFVLVATLMVFFPLTVEVNVSR